MHKPSLLVYRCFTIPFSLHNRARKRKKKLFSKERKKKKKPRKNSKIIT